MAQWKRVYALQAQRPKFQRTASTQKPNMAMQAYNPVLGSGDRQLPKLTTSWGSFRFSGRPRLKN